MQRQMLKSKIHRATVTACDVNYIGSATIDLDLLEAADILPNELVHIWDISNGSRFVTYAIAGERGSRCVQINGAAARLANVGDLVIVASFADYAERELDGYAPVVIHVDSGNRIETIDSDPGALLTGEPRRN